MIYTFLIKNLNLNACYLHMKKKTNPNLCVEFPISMKLKNTYPQKLKLKYFVFLQHIK